MAYRTMKTGRPSDAARGYVKNLFLEETGNPDYPDLITFPFRPSQVNIDTSVNEETMDPLGMSHQYKSYTNTTCPRVTFELYYNAWMMMKVMRGEVQASGGKTILQQMSDMIEQQRRWLQALLYSPRPVPGVIGSQQPPCILCLPGTITIRARLKQLGEIHSRNDIEGNILELRLPLVFEEAPLGRLTMEDVMVNGMFRTWGE